MSLVGGSASLEIECEMDVALRHKSPPLTAGALPSIRLLFRRQDRCLDLRFFLDLRLFHASLEEQCDLPTIIPVCLPEIRSSIWPRP
jgi:hypothetical protein